MPLWRLEPDLHAVLSSLDELLPKAARLVAHPGGSESMPEVTEEASRSTFTDACSITVYLLYLEEVTVYISIYNGVGCSKAEKRRAEISLASHAACFCFM